MTPDQFRSALLVEQFGAPTREYKPTDLERDRAADRLCLAEHGSWLAAVQQEAS